MSGDEKVRFCGSCEKHVYNLSSMTKEELKQVLGELEGPICGRILRRSDGTAVTNVCPWWSKWFAGTKLESWLKRVFPIERGNPYSMEEMGETWRDIPVVIAICDIEKGESLDNRVSPGSILPGQHPTDPLTNVEETIGRKARSKVRAGQILCKHCVE